MAAAPTKGRASPISPPTSISPASPTSPRTPPPHPITEANFGTGASGGQRLGRSAIIDENGEKIGVVGVTTPVFESITTPGGVRIIGPQTLDANDGDDSDFVALAAIVQAANRRPHRPKASTRS